MTDQKLRDTFFQLGRLSTEALEEGKYHDAFQYAIAAYSIAPDSEQHLKDSIMILAWKICEGFVSLRDSKGSE